MKSGDILDIWEEGAIAAVLFLGEEKGKLRVLTAQGREMRIPEARVANVVAMVLPPGAANEQLAAKVKQFDAEARARSAEVDLKALWDLVVDEGGGYGLEMLADLALGSGEGPRRAAVLRALVVSNLYFTRKQLEFTPRSREEMEESVKRLHAEEEKTRRRESLIALAREEIAQPTAAGPVWPEGTEKLLEAVKDVAVNGPLATRTKEAVPILRELGFDNRQNPEAGAFECLVRLKVFKPDENLHLLRYGVRRAFPAEVLAEAEAKASAGFTAGSDRRDLTALRTYAIDDSETTEVDDAVSIDKGSEPGTFVVGVHIADPAPYVAKGSLVDDEAYRRATTFYLPEERIFMLPPVVCEQAASLLEGSTRPAMSFLVTLDAAANVLSSQVTPSVITIARRLTYEASDALIVAGGGAPTLEEPFEGLVIDAASLDGPEESRLARELALWARLARLLLERRAEKGALILKNPDLDLKVTPAGMRLRRIEPWTQAWVLVSEAMVLANRIGARLLVDSKTPGIYRRQAAPDSPIQLPRRYDPAVVAVVRRQIKRTEIGLEPGPHAGLGLDAYIQVTSPLRRYQDLVGHRQLKAVLRGETPPYDKVALQAVAATCEETERAARDIERGSREYWLLKHLETLPGGTRLEATITRPEERRTLIELKDFLYLTELVPRTGHKPGRQLWVEIEAVNPRAGRLVVREV